jgi:hypothetical protein
MGLAGPAINDWAGLCWGTNVQLDSTSSRDLVWCKSSNQTLRFCKELLAEGIVALQTVLMLHSLNHTAMRIRCGSNSMWRRRLATPADRPRYEIAQLPFGM